jgi:hypothetical protein
MLTVVIPLAVAIQLTVKKHVARCALPRQWRAVLTLLVTLPSAVRGTRKDRKFNPVLLSHRRRSQRSRAGRQVCGRCVRCDFALVIGSGMTSWTRFAALFAPRLPLRAVLFR